MKSKCLNCLGAGIVIVGKKDNVSIQEHCPACEGTGEIDLTFREALTGLINEFSLEKGSDTPDFILANYLISCLDTFDLICRQRETWVGLADDG